MKKYILTSFIIFAILTFSMLSAMDDSDNCNINIANHLAVVKFRKNNEAIIAEKKKKLGTRYDAIAILSVLGDLRENGEIDEYNFSGYVLGISLGNGFRYGVCKVDASVEEMDIFTGALKNSAKNVKGALKFSKENVWSKSGRDIREEQAQALNNFFVGDKDAKNVTLEGFIPYTEIDGVFDNSIFSDLQYLQYFLFIDCSDKAILFRQFEKAINLLNEDYKSFVFNDNISKFMEEFLNTSPLAALSIFVKFLVNFSRIDNSEKNLVVENFNSDVHTFQDFIDFLTKFSNVKMVMDAYKYEKGKPFENELTIENVNFVAEMLLYQYKMLLENYESLCTCEMLRIMLGTSDVNGDTEYKKKRSNALRSYCIELLFERFNGKYSLEEIKKILDRNEVEITKVENEDKAKYHQYEAKYLQDIAKINYDYDMIEYNQARTQYYQDKDKAKYDQATAKYDQAYVIN